MKQNCLKVKKEIFSCCDKKTNKKFKELMNLQRNYTSAVFEIDEKNKRVLEIAERFGPKLTDFTLTTNGYRMCEVVLILLQQMPELEVLTLKCGFCSDSVCSLGEVVLKNLEKLVMTRSWYALKLIKAPELVELITLGSSKREATKSFLKALTKLESLTFELESLGKMDSEWPFRLKKFVSPTSFEMTENIENFLLFQAATIETLEIECLDSKFHEIVLENFKKLKVFQTNFHGLTASEEFYRNLMPMLSLKEISSSDGFSSQAAMKAVLHNCPKLSKLEFVVDLELSNHLNFIAEHNKKLKFLGVFVIKDTNAKFQFLESLTVSKIGKIDDFMDFLQAHPTIRTLKIEQLNDCDFYDDHIKILVFNRSLKHVCLTHIFGTHFAVTKVYNYLKMHGFGTWKKLELCANWITLNGYGGTDSIKASFSFEFYPGLELCENLFGNKHESNFKRGCGIMF